ncbi:hypothetical protein [Streptomyces sp. H39-S7]|uniref:hypothetical protein n=1 Tax=Streptomyces sp. H39-S7 TaxID=3004357 RepID=UPI0022AEA4EE|nr:hypothetical protein [Streptomyces sp. H39-S7]MCZ4125311.1 hypothetical protein [Streptomyces sp. H39-S7]
MSTGVIIAIVVVVIVLAAALTTVMLRPGGLGGRNLHRRFGPEYDRALRRHDGDSKAAEKELSERLDRHKDITLRPLSAEAREEYAARWAGVQEHFIDSPAKALGEADALIENLSRDRGFPDAKSGEHFDALSVHHARNLQGYRDAHEIAGRSGDDGTSTEEMREALVRARVLFEELMGADGKHVASRRDADTDRAEEPNADAEHGSGSRSGVLGRREN